MISEYLTYLKVTILLAASQWLYALYEWALMRRDTYLYVQKIFGDWHLLKVLMAGVVIWLIVAIPKRIDYVVWALFLRWTLWEYFSHVAHVSSDYNFAPSGGWLLNLFYLNKAEAIIYSVVIFIVGAVWIYLDKAFNYKIGI